LFILVILIVFYLFLFIQSSREKIDAALLHKTKGNEHFQAERWQQVRPPPFFTSVPSTVEGERRKRRSQRRRRRRGE